MRGGFEMRNVVSGKVPQYQVKFKVHFYEAGPDGKIRLASYLNYFQEAAGEHAAILGVSVTDLLEKNLTWVISRYHVRIWRYLTYSETVTLKTWPSGLQNFFALREFEASDEQGRLIAAATSSWMMIDLKKKRPVPPKEHLPAFSYDPRRAIIDAFEPLPRLEKRDHELAFVVRRRDLDWNKHVNHVVYVEWAVEIPSRDLLENYLPFEVEVDYRGEAFFGETVSSRVEYLLGGKKPLLLHQIVRESDQKELARLRTQWHHQQNFEERRHD
jgi:medium-chain acyl-[acyl-carrier-protein] hydrolase